MERETKINENHGIIYSNIKEGLMNQAFKLQRLQEEGVYTGSLLDETYEDLKTLIEDRDKENLARLREKLKDL